METCQNCGYEKCAIRVTCSYWKPGKPEPEPAHDIRWAAEQMSDDQPIKMGQWILYKYQDRIMIKGPGYTEPRPWAPTITEALATNYELVDEPAQPVERKCGDCEHLEPRRANQYYDACHHNYSLRIHRESVACKDFEQQAREL